MVDPILKCCSIISCEHIHIVFHEYLIISLANKQVKKHFSYVRRQFWHDIQSGQPAFTRVHLRMAHFMVAYSFKSYCNTCACMKAFFRESLSVEMQQTGLLAAKDIFIKKCKQFAGRRRFSFSYESKKKY